MKNYYPIYQKMENQDGYVYSTVLKVYCDLCLATFGQRKPADGHCVNCCNNLCSDCCKYHRTLGATKNHLVIQDIGGSQVEKHEKAKVNQESPTLIDKCRSHQKNNIEYHCSSCDLFCCSQCKMETHNRCSRVELILDATGDSKVENTIKSLQHIMTELERNKSKLTENEQKMKCLKESASAGFDEQRKTITQLLDQMKTELEKRIEIVERSSHSKLTSVSRFHATLTSELKSLTSNITDAQELGKSCELFKALRTADTDLPSLVSGLSTIERDIDTESDFSKGAAQIEQLINQMKSLVHTVQGACIRIQHS